MTNGVKEHRLSRNSSQKSEESQKDIQEYKYHCDECGEKFTDCYNYDNHMIVNKITISINVESVLYQNGNWRNTWKYTKI